MLVSVCNSQEEIINWVSQDGLRLGSLQEEWRENPRVVEAAVKQNGIAIGFAGSQFREDRQMGLWAVENNGLAYGCLGSMLRQDKVIKKVAEQHFPKYLPDYLRREYLLPVKNTKMVSHSFCFADFSECAELDSLKEALTSLEREGYHNQRVSLNLEKPGKSLFIRDSQICLFSGEYLIPRSPENFKNWVYQKDKKWSAVLPFALNQDVADSNEHIYMGHGFSRAKRRQAVTTAAEQGLPYILADTRIEGGNCFLFVDRGIKKALVGEWSLYFSYYALKEQGYFEDEEMIDDAIEPSLEALRMARNLSIYKDTKCTTQEYQLREKFLQCVFEKEIKAIDAKFSALEKQAKAEILNNKDLSFDQIGQAFKTRIKEIKEERKRLRKEALDKIHLDPELYAILKKERSYNTLCNAPVSSEDTLRYREKAQILQARLNRTKDKMAQELQVSRDNLIFLPQTTFHIDMRTFVTPSGEVVLHNSEYAKKFLEEILEREDMSLRTREFIQGYLKTAAIHLEAFKDVEEEQLRVLERNGLRYHRVPGMFNKPQVSELNYFNGIFLEKGLVAYCAKDEGDYLCKATSEGYAFLTTGSSYEEELPIHASIKELFQQRLGFQFKEVPGMSKFLALHSGGVHCLTSELFQVD